MQIAYDFHSAALKASRVHSCRRLKLARMEIVEPTIGSDL